MERGLQTPGTPNRVRFENIPETKKNQRRGSSKRSTSGSEPTFMSPLSFEEIDVKNTPLSSMRSCSEYQRQLSEQNSNKDLHSTPTRKSFWSSWFRSSNSPSQVVHNENSTVTVPSSSSSATKKKMKLAEVGSEESQFLVEKLRFNQANLYEGEDYHYSHSNEGHVGALPCFNLDYDHSDSGYSSHPHYHHPGRRRRNVHDRASFFGESTMAFDYLFGLRLAPAERPMEIELKCLSAPKYYTSRHPSIREETHQTHETNDEDTNRNDHDHSPPSTLNTIRRIPSFRSLSGGILNNAVNPQTSGTESGNRSRATSNAAERARIEMIDSTTQMILLKTLLKDYWQDILILLRRIFPASRGEDLFYESIRLQPFASGAYLRCMLLAGLSSTFFQIYNFVTWPSANQTLSSYGHTIEMFLYINLLIQVLFNVIQLPFRLRIHFLCWESSRAVEVDAAITIIRSMLQSESWLVNKALGKILDGLMIFNLIITEVYLWCSSRTDPLRGLMISLAATNMLTIVARVLVATIFSFSMHDPQVLSEARRRGLSKWDLDVLPTFVYSKAEEVNNSDCPICLCGFEMGEMLISLPCDAKHSFHASCIRQWLQRQNSCPLCQKLI
eukprot:gene7782-8415_t